MLITLVFEIDRHEDFYSISSFEAASNNLIHERKTDVLSYLTIL